MRKSESVEWRKRAREIECGTEKGRVSECERVCRERKIRGKRRERGGERERGRKRMRAK